MVDTSCDRTMCVVLADISGSMSDDKILQLNCALHRIEEAIKDDDRLRQGVDMLLITFGNEVKETVTWAQGYEQLHERICLLKADDYDNDTKMNEAILLSFTKIRERIKYYQNNSINYWQPHIFLLTDGFATDDHLAMEAQQEVEDAISIHNWRIFPIAIGESPRTISELQKFSPTGNTVLRFFNERLFSETKFSYMFASLEDWDCKDLHLIYDEENRKMDATPPDLKLCCELSLPPIDPKYACYFDSETGQLMRLPNNPGLPVLTCVIIVDTSGSMIGTKIEQVNEGLLKYIDRIENDDRLTQCVETSLVTFGSEVNKVISFATADRLRKELEPMMADGMTSMNEAILTALAQIRSRHRFLVENGIQYYRPWVFLLTDGIATDIHLASQAQVEIKKAVDDGRLVFCPIAIGNNEEILIGLSKLVPEGYPVLSVAENVLWKVFPKLATFIATTFDAHPTELYNSCLDMVHYATHRHADFDLKSWVFDSSSGILVEDPNN